MGRANLAVAGFVAGSALLVAAADPGGRGRAEGPVQSWLQPRPGQVLVIAHRGHSTDHPENTRAAFEAALRSGAELVETDVRMSREGELFCWHGERLARRRLSQLSADELSAHGVLRLAEFLELMGERVGVVLDLKQRNRGYTERVLAEVRQLGFLGRSVFGVHQVEHAALLRELEPGAAILGFLREPNQIPAFFAAGGDLARLYESDVGPESLAAARAGGRPVWVTTRPVRGRRIPGVIDAPRLLALLRLGIDGVLVNDPDQALDVRARWRAEATSPPSPAPPPPP